MVRSRTLTLAIVLALAWPEALLGQVTFEPSDCDFRVWFRRPANSHKNHGSCG